MHYKMMHTQCQCCSDRVAVPNVRNEAVTVVMKLPGPTDPICRHAVDLQ